MAGVRTMPSVASATFAAGMKRSYSGATAPSYGEPHPKKRKVIHKLHHMQPIQHIVEPINPELDSTGEYKDFFESQLRRAIALECKGIGFDSAKPEALEMLRGLVDEFMRNFLSQVRKSMISSRRTSTVPLDWIYALASTGTPGSAILEPHFDTGDLPPSLLLPPFDPPVEAEKPPVNLEGILGPELSGTTEKELRKYIPAHFPPFPSRHTWKATPVFTERENDPRKIREKATEEGIHAEGTLRKLMAAQKQGLQGNNAKKTRQSKRMKESDQFWKAAMKSTMDEEEARAEQERQRIHLGEEDMDEGHGAGAQIPRRRENWEEGVHVNYDTKFWRRSARGAG